MTFKLREGVYTAETDYGFALLDEDHDQYWTLNPTAAGVLRTLLDGGTPSDAVRTLTEEYEVDVDSADRNVRELVDELCAAGLAEQDGERTTARHRLHRRRTEKNTP
ncbi:lasso peptide biosynthesis PqqD family chaperone [Streptomyces sp. ISL-36]|uniref:lasso peptide biosynthesis PqqD family chaperone n=1 Tax=Streptomyces sp. ISL-36 TaxID=2819182 RepID=UPI001BE5E469|nr:lasso peptide biosynthesis PqqD family chaperone [Streptomyces sp. ISL-36]MBT2445220.1 lasso peptide biosynthesis PqqD family chaperone [Streptomyces sp. ISL-36]